MNKKKLNQGLLIAAAFVAAGWMLKNVYAKQSSSVENVAVITSDTADRKVEDKTGKALLNVFKAKYAALTEKEIVVPITHLVRTLCTANNIDPNSVTVHVLDNEAVNAFALPGGDIVLYSGTISDCLTPEVLAGILAHEIAHLQVKHVDQKMAANPAIAQLAATAGGAGSKKFAEAAGIFSTTAFDSKLEHEADLKAVAYMQKAGIPTNDFTKAFLEALAKDSKTQDHLVWISSHPDPYERAANIRAATAKDKAPSKPLLDTTTWHKLQLAAIGIPDYEEK